MDYQRQIKQQKHGKQNSRSTSVCSIAASHVILYTTSGTSTLFLTASATLVLLLSLFLGLLNQVFISIRSSLLSPLPFTSRLSSPFSYLLTLLLFYIIFFTSHNRNYVLVLLLDGTPAGAPSSKWPVQQRGKKRKREEEVKRESKSENSEWRREGVRGTRGEEKGSIGREVINLFRQVRFFSEYYHMGSQWYLQQFPPITPNDFPDKKIRMVRIATDGVGRRDEGREDERGELIIVYNRYTVRLVRPTSMSRLYPP